MNVAQQTIYCEGSLAIATPVYLARISNAGSVRMESKRPVCYACERCGEMLQLVNQEVILER